jgi:steroid 5-alpha reductase family enzyme
LFLHLPTMPGEIFKLFLAAWAFAIVLMAVAWLVSRNIRNAGIVDIAWSAGYAPMAAFYAAVGAGNFTRRWLMAGLVILWSARLALHLFVRVKRLHPEEDRRYHALRAEWGANAERKMFWFFQMQAMLLVALSVPFLLVCLNERNGLTVPEYTGVGIWFVAFIGEALADHQLKMFKANAANKGRVCQAGLWRYSRHPNYFFEWLIWLAFFVIALSSRWGWVTIYCPALMLFFLLKVTGIPMTEELAVKTKGEEYRAYQRTTSGFVPWFRKDGCR